jgi:anti-anti-sigma regulatory factor/anti-sigma regulatory factor (Ser/Thr protein kinase)
MYGDAVAEHVLGRMQHPNGFVDDVALLIVQRRTPPEPFHMSGRAEDDEDARVLTRFGQWLDALGVGLLDHVALGGALREVLASVMSHAERERHGDRRFAVEATLGTDAVVRLRVSDSNRWRAEDGARGPGLVVAGGLVDHLRLHHTADGTDVIMEQAIGRPVPLLQSQAVDSGTGRPVPDLTGPSDLAVSVGAGHAEVAGAIGVDEIEAFRETVHEATLAGTLPATIDLGGVTRLGGPAVRVLFEYLERANESGVSFRVVVDPGSAADHFLTQTDMPHEVRDPEGSPEDGDQ